jgi:putative flippase GtrA
MLDHKKARYLLVGGVNTLAGYCIGVGFYKLLGGKYNIFWIGIFSNIFSITFSFLAYKIFVFRTRGMWINEYIKSFILYGGVALISIFFLWLFVEKMRITIWIAQAIVIFVTVIISYIGNSRFTFSRSLSN